MEILRKLNVVNVANLFVSRKAMARADSIIKYDIFVKSAQFLRQIKGVYV